MNRNKLEKIEFLMFAIASVIALLAIYYFGPSITGLVVQESSYSDDLSLVATSSGNYTWQLQSAGGLSSVKLDGKVTNYGAARVYIESSGIRYLIFDSSKLDELAGAALNQANLITGAVAGDGKDENKTKDEEKQKNNKKPVWVSGYEFVINGTTAINLSQHFTDKDNDALVYAASEVEGLSINVEDEIAAITPINYGFNTTITFTASDGINSKSEIVRLEVLAQSTENHAPKWISGNNQFIFNNLLYIDLLEYFTDEDDDALTFTASDAADIVESIDGSILALSASIGNFNSSIAITAYDGDLSFTKELKLVIPSIIAITETNETIDKAVTINLAYKSGTVYDANDNGEESINGVVDMTVEGTSFSWDADESRLCARWEVYNADENILTTFCNGNDDCCAFVGLLPSSDKWDEIYYSAFAKDGAGYGNTVSAQVIYYDVNISIPIAEIYNSEWQNLSVKFFDDETEFLDACIETCALAGMNKSSYTLIFEVEDGAVLSIDKIKYSILSDMQNSPPVLIKNFSAINISGNENALINLSEHFSDPDGDILNYDYYKTDNVAISFADDIAAVSSAGGFAGVRLTFITASDADSSIASNIFAVNISSPEFNLPTVDISKGSFEIRGKNDSRLFVIDSFGNLNIKGNLAENADLASDENDFAIESLIGIGAAVKNPEGDLLLKGSLNENLDELIPTPNSFIIQNRDGQPVAYFSGSGSMFLKGSFTDNVLFG